MESHGGMTTEEEPMNSEKNLSQCQFVHHKSHMGWPESRHGPKRTLNSGNASYHAVQSIPPSLRLLPKKANQNMQIMLLVKHRLWGVSRVGCCGLLVSRVVLDLLSHTYGFRDKVVRTMLQKSPIIRPKLDLRVVG
jgi:hypothetical protein